MMAALAGPAGAKEVVRKGVPIDSLTPEGLTRSDVTPPAAEGLPVRITYAGADGKTAVVMDVVVGRDAAEARAALETARRGVTRTETAEERTDLGDTGFGGGRIVGFVKDNVMIVVRRVRQADTEDIATSALTAVEAAPAAAKMVPPGISVVHEGATVSVGGGFLATRIVATGAGYVRARGQGTWSIVRTAEGAIELKIVTVDSLLRVSRSSSSY